MTQGVFVVNQLFPLIVASVRHNYELITLLSPVEGNHYYQNNFTVISSLMGLAASGQDAADEVALV